MRVSQDASFTNMVQAGARKVKVIPDLLYNYMSREGSACRKFVGKKGPEEQIICNYKSFKVVCDYWVKNGYAANHEHVLLTRLVKRTYFWTPTNLKYAKEILASFGPDIYNPETIKKCDAHTKQLIKKLEDAASHPEKYKDRPASPQGQLKPSQQISLRKRAGINQH